MHPLGTSTSLALLSMLIALAMLLRPTAAGEGEEAGSSSSNSEQFWQTFSWKPASRDAPAPAPAFELNHAAPVFTYADSFLDYAEKAMPPKKFREFVPHWQYAVQNGWINSNSRKSQNESFMLLHRRRSDRFADARVSPFPPFHVDSMQHTVQPTQILPLRIPEEKEAIEKIRPFIEEYGGMIEEEMLKKLQKEVKRLAR